MKKPIDLSKVPDDAEVGRTSAMRQSYVAGSGRPKKLGQCPKCGVEMGTVELRKHRCPVTDVRAWLREHSTEATVARFDAGLLPEEELHAGMTDVTFAPLDAEWPRYRKITDQEVREAWNEVVRDGDGDLDLYEDSKVIYRSNSCQWGLTTAQRSQLKAMRAALPATTITPRLHESSLDRNDVPWGVVKRYSALVKVEVVGVKLRREYGL